MSKKVVILHTDDTWIEIPIEDLDTWMTDGSLSKGDIIVHPEKVQVVHSELVIKDR